MTNPVFDRYLTRAEEKQLFKTVRQDSSPMAERDINWMVLMRQTGIRVTPMSKLTVGDAQSALLTDHLVIRAITNKRKKAHSIFLTKPARQAIENLILLRRRQGYVNDLDEPLVMSKKRQGLSVRSYQSLMKRWAKRAGISSDVSPHTFRHTLAKRVVETSTHKEPLLVAQRALGHSSIKTTAIYAKPDKEQMQLDLARAAR